MPPVAIEVVDDEDAVARPIGVGVDLDRVHAIFEDVVLADRLSRQLALLADRDEAAAKAMRDGAAEDETARLDAGDMVEANADEGQDHRIHRGPKAPRIGKERGDVAKRIPVAG